MRSRIAIAVLLLAVTAAGLLVVHGRGVLALPNNDSHEITVALGEAFTIELAANPSTGYSWSAQHDESCIELVEHDLKPSASGMPGAPGTDSFEFKAIAKGQHEIRLAYQRPWESQIERLVIYRITVR